MRKIAYFFFLAFFTLLLVGCDFFGTTPSTTVKTTPHNSTTTSTTDTSVTTSESELTMRLRSIYQLALDAGAFNGTYEEWLDSVRGPQGEPGRDVNLQVSGGYIQWQYAGDLTWTNLISLATLTGANGLDGTDGTDGKEVVFQVAEGYIQWQYAGDLTWTNLVSLATLTGADGTNGTDGTDGVDGREVLFQVADGYIQWQYDGDLEWTNLVELTTLTGASAYELYLLNYPDYVGTELEWLEDLIYGRLADIEQWNVTYDYNDGVTSSISVVADNLTKLTKPINPTREGYSFLGWYIDGEQWSFSGFVVTEDITLTAKWVELDYTIVFEEAKVSLNWYDASELEYHIKNIYEFNGVGYLARHGVDFQNKVIYLDEDLDIMNETIVQIYGFYGTFDGQNNCIKNYSYTNTNLDKQNIEDSNFGSSLIFANYGIIRNLNLVDYILDIDLTDIHSLVEFYSMLVGINYGLIENCFINGSFNININTSDPSDVSNIHFSPFVLTNVGDIINSEVNSITTIISNQSFNYGHFGLDNEGYIEKCKSSGAIFYEHVGSVSSNIGGLFNTSSPLNYHGIGPNVVDCVSEVNISTLTYYVDQIGGAFSRYSGEITGVSYAGVMDLSTNEENVPLMARIGGIAASTMNRSNFDCAYKISNSTFSGVINLKFLNNSYFHYESWSTPEINIGGIVGEMFNAETTTIEDCLFSGRISISENYASENNNVMHQIGGIVGQAYIIVGENLTRNITIINCDTTGEIYVDSISNGFFWSRIGGILGQAYIGTNDDTVSSDDVSVDIINCSFSGKIQLNNSHNKYILLGGIVGAMYSTLVENSSSFGTLIVPSEEFLFGAIAGYAAYSKELDMGKTMARIINCEANIHVVEGASDYYSSSLFGGYDFVYIHQDFLREQFENKYYFSLLDTEEQLFYEDLYNWAYELEWFDTLKYYNWAYELEWFDTLKYIFSYIGPFDYVKYNLTYEDAMNVIVMFLFDNPSFYFIDISQGVYTFSPLDDFIGLQISDRYSITSISSDNAVIDNVVTEMKETVNGMSDYEKLNYIYNYLIDNIQYISDETSRYTLVGSLIVGDAVCQGYAMAFKFLCDQVGINCVVISSQEMDHAWNIVFVEDQWYIVDVTWADTSEDNYFLIGYDALQYYDIDFFLPVPTISETDFQVPN